MPVGSNIGALAVYNGKLYAGDAGNGKIYSSVDGLNWTAANGGSRVSPAGIQALTVFNGRLYAGDSSGGLFLTADGTAWTAANAGAPVGSSIAGLSAFNGKLYTADGKSGKVYQLTPVPAALTGADGTKSAQTLTATGLNLSLSTNSVTCGGISPCGATNQVIFTASDLAGNAARLGPFAVRVGTAPSISTPTAASGFAGTAQGASSILWTWTNNASNQAGCRVMSGTTNISGDLAANSTYWLQTGLSANTPYGPYVARAFNSGGAADSASASRYTLANMPSGLAATDVGLSSATLVWSASGNPAGTVWDLQRSADGASYASRYASSLAAGYTDTGLAPGTTYYYEVRAQNADGIFTSFTGPIAVHTMAPPSASPTALIVSGNAITASASATGEPAAFDFEASSSPDFASSVSSSDFIPSQSYTFTALQVATTYYVRATARDRFGNVGAPSAPLAAATLANVYVSTGLPAAAAAVQGGRVALLRLALQTDPGAAASWTSLRVRSFGTVQDSDIAAVEIFADAGGRGVFDALTDPLLGSAAIIGGMAVVPLNVPVTSASSKFFVAYRLSPLATPNATAGASVSSASDIGLSSPFAAVGAFPATSRLAPIQDSPNTVDLAAASLAPTSTSPGVLNLPVLKLTAVADTGMSVLNTMTLSLAGTLPSSGLAAVRIYRDSNGNGVLDASDALLTSGSDRFSNGVATLVFTASQADRTITSAPAVLFVAVDIAPGALPGATFSLSLAAPSSVGLAGAADTVTFSGAQIASQPTLLVNTLTAALSAVAPLQLTQGYPYAMVHATLTVDYGQATISRLLVGRTGSSADADVAGVRVYRKAVPNGAPFDPSADILLGTGAFLNGSASIDFQPVTLTAGAPTVLLVVYSVAKVAIVGHTLGASLNQLQGESSYTNVAGGIPFESPAGEVVLAVNHLLVSAADASPASLLQGATNVALLRLQVRADRDQVSWSGLDLTRLGNGPDSDIGAVAVFRDGDGNGALSSADALVTSGRDVFAGGKARLSFIAPETIGAAPVTYFVAVTVGPGAAPGDSLGLRLASAADLSVAAPNVASTGPPTFPFDAGPIPVGQYPNLVAVTAEGLSPDSSPIPGALDVGLVKLTMKTNVSNAGWLKLHLDRIGTSADTEIAAVKLYYDVNGLGVFDPTRIGQYQLLSVAQSSADLRFASPVTLGSVPKTFFLAIDVATGAVAGNTVGLGAASASCFSVDAPNGVAPVAFVSPPAAIHHPPNLVEVVAMDAAPPTAAPGSAAVPMLTLGVWAQTYTGRWGGLTVGRTGTAGDADTTRIGLYTLPEGVRSLNSSVGTLVATGTFVNGQAVLTFLSVQTVTTSTRTYFLAYDVSPVATSSATLGASLSGPGSFLVAAPSSAAAAAFQSALTVITPNRLAVNRDAISNVSSYPNPFDSRTGAATIAYNLAANADTELQIVDAFGVKVRGMRFGAGSQGGKAGANAVAWDGSDDYGRKVSMGLYVCLIRSGGSKAFQKMLVHH